MPRHPVRGAGALQDAGAEAKYHEAQRAYETLSDKDKRQMYDQVTQGRVPSAHATARRVRATLLSVAGACDLLDVCSCCSHASGQRRRLQTKRLPYILLLQITKP